MSVVPPFRACTVCELTRPELAGKLIILGFFGVCPNVDVGIARLDQPAFLTFLITGDRGDGTFVGHVALYDETDERVVAEVPEMRFTASPGAFTTISATLMPVFGRPGLYSIRLFVEQQEHFRAEFRISQGVS